MAGTLTPGRVDRQQEQATRDADADALPDPDRPWVTIVWNDDPGNPVNVAIPTNAAGATQIDKFGRTVGSVTASGGYENVTLLPATNNNNFDCFSAHGCDPPNRAAANWKILNVSAGLAQR